MSRTVGVSREPEGGSELLDAWVFPCFRKSINVILRRLFEI